MPSAPSVEPYDALLLVSFGGPEKADDVVPFLENVTAGRGIPRERLQEVGQHYFDLGGRSPINDQCRELIAAIREDFDEHGLGDLPIYWGNRNWDPFLADTLKQMGADGIRRAAAFVTSAYASYSGCRQYREDLFRAGSDVGHPPLIEKLRHYFNHPGFVGAMSDATAVAFESLPEAERESAALLFVTHSIPTTMADSSGPDGGAYVAQHRDVAATVADEVRERTGWVTTKWELVYCSRSGSGTPWLEPDVNQRIRELAQAGTTAVVLVPIGFVSDHMEVVYDLDTEAAKTAADLGLHFARAATAGVHPGFVGVVRDLVTERAAVVRGEHRDRASAGRLGPAWDLCSPACCPNLRDSRPTVSEEPVDTQEPA
jgi:ferrochelatase